MGIGTCGTFDGFGKVLQYVVVGFILCVKDEDEGCGAAEYLCIAVILCTVVLGVGGCSSGDGVGEPIIHDCTRVRARHVVACEGGRGGLMVWLAMDGWLSCHGHGIVDIHVSVHVNILVWIHVHVSIHVHMCVHVDIHIHIIAWDTVGAFGSIVVSWEIPNGEAAEWSMVDHGPFEILCCFKAKEGFMG